MRLAKIGIWAAVVVIVGAVMIGLHQRNTPAGTTGKPVVKIGLVFPLTGLYREPDELRKAMAYMLDKYQDGPLEYILIAEDSVGQATKGISATKKLIHLDRVHVILSANSGVAKVISPLATQSNILHVAIALDANLEGNPTSFTAWTTAEKKARKYVDYLKKKGVKDTAAFVSVTANSEELYRVFKPMAEAAGIRVTKYGFMPGVRDFRIDLMKIKNKKHDLVTFLVWPPEADIVMRQYKEVGVGIPVSGMEVFSIANQKELFEGETYVDGCLPESDVLERIRDQVKAAGTYGFAVGYDLLDMLNRICVDFYERNKRIPSGTELADALVKMGSHDGVAGRVEIGKDRRIQSDACLLKIVDGRPVAIGE
ncbi:MAG: ABC transporter substrate-binding protein [Alphaproteobacteria bacterium]|nr:ABC transporter substrate-binding protein [Alphaproteobacteria bacterium]